ncbi:response regulator [Scytonema sp. UIC 10036]|uniref:hybrid sensor histidine kinase/response regulator n=1 Tax=Scytonema sp. UIC 10036 TaxID=2304196 RepID=UPI0012DA71C4|nr:ATP-binding protein [Scytonema sp. UIC 10036]MUG98174.1 response regulator [Scytonema sp. UIC 10036]
MTNDAGASASTSVRVLIVEDEWVVAIDVRDCLEALGFSVVAIAASGEEAIIKARELRPDIVFMDIRLEGEMDGIQAAQQIWNELQIPIIYATGYSDKATVDRAIATEPFGYVLKPIKESDLYAAITLALQQQARAIQFREDRKWMATILKAIGDGVIVTDTQSQVKYLNLVAESLTGWQLQEALNRPLSQVLPLCDEQTQVPIENPVTQVLQTDEIAYLVNPVLLTRKDGSQILVADSAAPIRDDEGVVTGAVMVFRDVTNRQSLQEQSFSILRAQLLEQEMQELQRLAQLKDAFLRTVSHELRSPLANIKMVIHLLEINLNRQRLSPSESEVDSQSQQIEQYLTILREECDQELNLVNDLLDLQRLEAEETPIELTSIEVGEWIAQITEVYQERAQERQQRLDVFLPSTLPILVSDILMLTRVLRELLTNACKYTPPGEVITVSAESVGERLRLVIRNSGVEIPEEELPRIFDKFYRIPGSDRWTQGGTGLGLALVKKQITYLGGSIHVESSANEVRFAIELPFTSGV